MRHKKLQRIKKLLSKEFKYIKKEKKRCAKTYPDWRDDEYNMLADKFIWAIPENPDVSPSFMTLNQALVTYNRDQRRYHLYIDCYHFDTSTAEGQQSMVNTLKNIKEAFADFVFSFDEDKIIPYHTLTPEDVNAIFMADSLEALYCKFALLVSGFETYYN